MKNTGIGHLAGKNIQKCVAQPFAAFSYIGNSERPAIKALTVLELLWKACRYYTAAERVK